MARKGLAKPPVGDCIVDGLRRRQHRFDLATGLCTLCGAKRKGRPN